MFIISAILYFLSHHPILSIPLIWLSGGALVALLTKWRPKRSHSWLLIVAFVYSLLNFMVAPMVNGLFLNAFGTRGTAVIIQERETNSRLNEQPVSAYDVVIKTADGDDVKSSFDTMTATIYPWSNSIRIPPVGERFVVNYIRGFPRNMAIMREESAYGKRYNVAVAMGEVRAKQEQLKASPDNAAFQQEYRAALQQFLDEHGKDADPKTVQHYRAALEQLGK